MACFPDSFLGLPPCLLRSTQATTTTSSNTREFVKNTNGNAWPHLVFSSSLFYRLSLSLSLSLSHTHTHTHTYNFKIDRKMRFPLHAHAHTYTKSCLPVPAPLKSLRCQRGSARVEFSLPTTAFRQKNKSQQHTM